MRGSRVSLLCGYIQRSLKVNRPPNRKRFVLHLGEPDPLSSGCRFRSLSEAPEGEGSAYKTGRLVCSVHGSHIECSERNRRGLRATWRLAPRRQTTLAERVDCPHLKPWIRTPKRWNRMLKGLWPAFTRVRFQAARPHRRESNTGFDWRRIGWPSTSHLESTNLTPKPSRTQRLCTLSSSLLVILASPPPTTGRNPSFSNVASQGQGPLLWSPSHAIRTHMPTSSQKEPKPNPPFSMLLPRSHGMELCSVSVCGLDKKAAQLETRPSALSSQRA